MDCCRLLSDTYFLSVIVVGEVKGFVLKHCMTCTLFFTISVPSMETTQARERLRHWQHKYKFIFEFFDPITDLDLSRFRERTTALLSCEVDMILISRLLGSVTATLSLSTLQIPNGSDCKRTFVMKTPVYWNILTQRLWKSHIMRRPSERYRPLVMTQSILSDGSLT